MSRKRTATLASIALAGVVSLTGCGNGAATSPPGPSVGASAQGSAAGEHNAADVEFAQGMVPHHAQAIEMSDMVLAKDGVDERVLRLAERIKAAQGPEIEQMTGWLEEWGAEVPDDDAAGMDHSTMGHGSGGMMSEEDMAALAEADGAQAARLFLQQMVAHHEGAVTMAQTEVADGADAAATRLAQAVIDAQRAEIAEMNELLQEL